MTISAAHIFGWFEGEEGYNALTCNFTDALGRCLPVYRIALPRRNGERLRGAPEVQ
jgi:hypothetical protein